MVKMFRQFSYQLMTLCLKLFPLLSMKKKEKKIREEDFEGQGDHTIFNLVDEEDDNVPLIVFYGKRWGS